MSKSKLSQNSESSSIDVSLYPYSSYGVFIDGPSTIMYENLDKNQHVESFTVTLQFSQSSFSPVPAQGNVSFKLILEFEDKCKEDQELHVCVTPAEVLQSYSFTSFGVSKLRISAKSDVATDTGIATTFTLQSLVMRLTRN